MDNQQLNTLIFFSLLNKSRTQISWRHGSFHATSSVEPSTRATELVLTTFKLIRDERRFVLVIAFRVSGLWQPRYRSRHFVCAFLAAKVVRPMNFVFLTARTGSRSLAFPSSHEVLRLSFSDMPEHSIAAFSELSPSPSNIFISFLCPSSDGVSCIRMIDDRSTRPAPVLPFPLPW